MERRESGVPDLVAAEQLRTRVLGDLSEMPFNSKPTDNVYGDAETTGYGTFPRSFLAEFRLRSDSSINVAFERRQMLGTFFEPHPNISKTSPLNSRLPFLIDWWCLNLTGESTPHQRPSTSLTSEIPDPGIEPGPPDRVTVEG